MPQADKTLTAILPWLGSKRTLAERIVAEIGAHHAYYEPFAASMAVLLRKPPCRTETVSDLHGDLINVARCIQHPVAGAQLYRRLRRTLCSEGLFHDARAVVTQPFDPEGGIDVNRAYHYFVLAWLGLNGLVGSAREPANFAKRFTSGGGDPAKRWQTAIRSVPHWRDRLANVSILCACGLTLCEKVEDKAGVIIYVDAPYLAKVVQYKHDFTPADHTRLAQALNRFRHTRVLVSYYDHPLLTPLYTNWRRVELVVNKGLANASYRDGNVTVAAPEVLLCNF